MPLLIPRIDDRDYGQLRQEALERIPVHNPEWTNFNESDPGVTVLELFAFLADSLLYRANLIPERNRIKFLTMLGIGLRPPEAARGVITIANERGPLQALLFREGLTVRAGKTTFATTDSVDLLPIEAQNYYRRRLSTDETAKAAGVYDQLYGSYEDERSELEFYQSVQWDAPATAAAIQPLNLGDDTTVDGSLWIALLTRPREEALSDIILREIAGHSLSLALMPLIEESRRVLEPGGPTTAQTDPPVIIEISTGQMSNDRLPVYKRLDARFSGNPLEDLTRVELTLPAYGGMGTFDLDPLEEGVGDLPPVIEDPQVSNRVLAWLRVRFVPDAAGSSTAFEWQLSWAGINGARITQRVEVVSEAVSRGTGEPDQQFPLVNTPVLPESVRLTVNGETWTRIDDLLAAPPEIPVRNAAEAPGVALPPTGDPKVYAVDRTEGLITFGNGLRGARPPRGVPIIASYAYGGGAAGNVGVGAIKTAPQLPPGFKVSNPLPTWGGSEGETPAEGERNIPAYLKHRDRAVSRDDFLAITWQTPGVNLGRAEFLSLFHPDAGWPSPGVVTMLVIPDDPNRPQAPVPDQNFLDAVCRYLEPRRLLTTEVHVAGPEYVGISVTVGIDVVPGRDVAPVREAVKDAIRTMLSPLKGGVEQTGWPLEKAVEDRELWVTAARVPGVASVRGVRLWNAQNIEIPTLEIHDLQLPQLLNVGVDLGPAQAPGSGAAAAAKRRVAVPVLPATC
jgi:hypothetical protein